MDKYISREAVNNMLLEQQKKSNNFDAIGKIIDIRRIAKIPAADMAEVRHGEWIYHECVSTGDGMVSGYSCSECCTFVREEMFEEFEDFYKDYCGHCGAKMDGGQGDV